LDDLRDKRRKRKFNLFLLKRFFILYSSSLL